MTYDEFKSRYIGGRPDYNEEILGQAHDPSTYAQCVDLVHFWMRAIGSPVIMGDAITLKGDHSGYTWTANSSSNFPSQGDIIVFQIGKYGHTGVVESANPYTVDVLNENDPLASPVKVTRFDYQNPLCLGWLHPSVLDVPVPAPVPAPVVPPVEVSPPTPPVTLVIPENPPTPIQPSVTPTPTTVSVPITEEKVTYYWESIIYNFIKGVIMSWLSGKKTYFVLAVAIISSIVGAWNGTITWLQCYEAILTACTAAGFRSAIK